MSIIYFKSGKEVSSFCEFLFFSSKYIDVHWRTSEKWGNQLAITKCSTVTNDEEIIAKAMVDVFVKHRLNTMINEVITKVYHYSNIDEIYRIMDVANGIVENKYPHMAHAYGNSTDLLYTLFKKNLDNSQVVHFDSIIQFSTNLFRDKLIEITGLAIDEFKREEEHQTYINALREYIDHQSSIYSEIHLVQGRSFVFYKPSGKPFGKQELEQLMIKEPLYLVGLDKHELNLAPLIAMAPQTIYIYGDHPSEPKTLTVINVFQERVTFKPLSHFPFSRFTKKL